MKKTEPQRLALLSAQELLQEILRTIADNDTADAIDSVLIEIAKALDPETPIMIWDDNAGQ